jgi:Glycosyltransferase Family 4
MRRLLLIAYHFPPDPAVGSRRPGFLARFLPEFGWDVTVLTRQGGDHGSAPCEVVTAPVLGSSIENRVRGAMNASDNPKVAQTSAPLRVLLQRLREAALFPDNTAPWLPGAISAGLRASRRGRFDAVLSTAMPPSVHVVGATVARARKLPWLADYRDPWTGNAYNRRAFVRSALERKLERSLVRRAGAVVTVNDPIARQLSELHGRKVSVIPNAFDRSEWDTGSFSIPSRFELCYTGSMYDGQRTPDLLFGALAELQREGAAAGDAKVVFYGPNSDTVGEAARRFGVEGSIERRGIVLRPDAIAAQRSASDLLLFLSMDPETTGELGSKILEYCGSRRPILAFGPRESVIRPFLAEHNIGWFACDPGEAKAALVSAHERFVAGEWDVPTPDGAFFDARAMAQAFAQELDAIV